MALPFPVSWVWLLAPSDIGHKKHAHVCNVWRSSGPLADPASFDCLKPCAPRFCGQKFSEYIMVHQMSSRTDLLYGKAKCATSNILMKGYTWTVLEPHNFRSLWIFGCGPKNHFWAKSDGFNDTILMSKSWSFASFLRHFASYFWSFQM